jgi:capsid protein
MILDLHGRPLQAPAPQRSPTRVRARYDAAQSGGTHAKHWTSADYLSPDMASSPAVRRTLRSRCRYEAANNSYAAGIISTLANYVVGTGPQLRLIAPMDASDRVQRNLLKLAQAFNAWAWDIGLGRKLQTMRKAKSTDGEGFGMLVTRQKPPDKISLGVSIFEADMVTDPTLASVLDPDKPEGIELGPDGEPIRYKVLKTHPGSAASALYDSSAITVPANQILHWYDETRPGMHRGIPEITPALPMFAQLRRYTSAAITAAETAADFAGVMQNNTPPDGEAAAVEVGTTFDLEKGQLVSLPEGWSLGQMKAEQPGPLFETVIRCIVREIGRCIDMPYAVAAMDASGHNYSSMRGDWQAFFQSILTQHYGCEQQVLEKILVAWMAEARYVFPLQFPTEWDYQWDWPAAEPTDPVKQAAADEIDLKNRTTTYARVYSRRGLNGTSELRQVAREQAFLRENKIEVPETGKRPSAEEPQ